MKIRSQMFSFVIVGIVQLFSTHAWADSIQAYFNHNKNNSYTDPYYQRTRLGDNLEKVLLDAIDQAQKTISIAVYELDLPLVAKALVKKNKLGLQINVVVDNSNSKVWAQLGPEEIDRLNFHSLRKYNGFVAFADTNKDGQVSLAEQVQADSLLILKEGGINWIDDTADGGKGTGLMHHKMMIIDDQILITGSANFTKSCVHGDFLSPESKGNANSLLRIENKQIINHFQNEFNEMWLDHRFGVKKSFRGSQIFKVNGIAVAVQFSPTTKKKNWNESTNGLIAKQLAGAKYNSDLALFVFSEQKIVDALKSANDQGMKNRTLIEPEFATKFDSELLDILGVQLKNSKCQYEVNNQPWSPANLSAGYPDLDIGDVLHHKFAVIDQEKVIVGSHNWSDAANTQNDEALLVIQDPLLANQYTQEFETIYAKATLGISPFIAKKISDQETACALRSVN